MEKKNTMEVNDTVNYLVTDIFFFSVIFNGEEKPKLNPGLHCFILSASPDRRL